MATWGDGSERRIFDPALRLDDRHHIFPLVLATVASWKAIQGRHPTPGRTPTPATFSAELRPLSADHDHRGWPKGSTKKKKEGKKRISASLLEAGAPPRRHSFSSKSPDRDVVGSLFRTSSLCTNGTTSDLRAGVCTLKVPRTSDHLQGLRRTWPPDPRVLLLSAATWQTWQTWQGS